VAPEADDGLDPPDRPDDPRERGLDVGAFIREQRLLGRVSLRGLAESAGVSNPYLSQIERGLRRPSAEILRQIAQALQISAETLYVRAGILDEPSGEVDVVGAINGDRHLTDEQKRTLVHIYQSFRDQVAEGPAATEGAATQDADEGELAAER